ncbi:MULTISPECIES: alpha/beta fold hydrolase [Roseomonadaceae]|uniref:Alpha/beta hydrolase n=1 Tax=Falsiroseomonas oleicola TaxID=2801474 RepID=A0ABS6H998_9PROT|nr:alpha/beta hydrolase [Roseomonas oleicola]MBU8545250.1 alpha/beta hydrolase [Roseomonas oleicola]
MIRTRDGVGLFHREAGQGAAVVFLASWSLPSDSWFQQMHAMAAAGLRAVAYDRRGHGRSDDPGRGWDYDTLADDLADVLAALDLRGVTLVAMSGAAGEAVRYLTRHGRNRIARLALIGPTTPLLVQRPDNPDGIPAAALDALREELRQDFPAWLERNARAFGGPRASDAMLGWICALARQASLPGLLAFHRSLTETDFRAELRALDLPVLVVQGDADATCPIELTGAATAALVPGARLLAFRGAPHGLIVSDPERLAAELVAFATD